MYTLEELLQTMVDKNASDLHITAGSPPRIRVDGELKALGEEMLAPERPLASMTLQEFSDETSRVHPLRQLYLVGGRLMRRFVQLSDSVYHGVIGLSRGSGLLRFDWLWLWSRWL